MAIANLEKVCSRVGHWRGAARCIVRGTIVHVYVYLRRRINCFPFIKRLKYACIRCAVARCLEFLERGACAKWQIPVQGVVARLAIMLSF